MAGETKLTVELNKLLQMPYFWPRFICLSLVLAANDFARMFVKTAWLVPLIVVLVLSGVCFLVFEFFTLKKIKPQFKIKNYAIYLWLIFGLVCIISEIITNGIPLNSLLILIILPAFVIMGQEEGFFNFFLLSCALTILANITLGLCAYPFINNNFSLALASFVPVLLCALAWVLLNTGKFYTEMFVCLTCLIAELLYLSGASGGRTGFMTILITVFVFVLAIGIKFTAAKKHVTYKISSINFAIILCVVLLVSITVSAFIVLDDSSNIVESPSSIENLSTWEKFVTAFSNGNLFSNRGTIWKYTLSNVKLFGNGADFYSSAEILSPEQTSAHNTFLAVLGHFGIIAFVLFMVFCIYMLLLSVRYCIRSRRLYIFPFITLTAFYFAGITEDLIFMYNPRVFLLLFYAACAFLITYETKRKAEIKAKR
ncbi:MAG: O-antigen ligase family protein [Clostridia bacterium]|nr:O-antigen ligase family protein [Clostridia bacterium]